MLKAQTRRSMEKSGAMMADFDEKENSTDMDGFQQHLFDCFG